MRPNPLRAGVERGELQIGTWVNSITTPSIIPLLKSAGLDFARVDMEHTAITIEAVAQMALLGRALDFAIAVRPPKSNREWITRLLDIGIWNLHCPQIESAEHAREVVSASRYSPMGLRGHAGFSPATDFQSDPKWRDFANQQVFVTAMFETGAALEELDEIAAMPGIDALTIGPGDLAQEMGVYGTPDQNRLMDEKRDMVLAAAKKHGKACSMLVQTREQALHWKKEGALILAYSSEVKVLHDALSSAVRDLKGTSK